MRLSVYVAILFASWNFNLLGLPDSFVWSRSEIRAGYLGTESHLVLYRINRSELPLLHPLFSESANGPQPYRSQFGAQGITLAAIQRLTGMAPASLAMVAAALFVLFTALVVASILLSAQQYLGAPVGDLACALAAFTPVFVKFAPSLYWVVFLLLLPFALVWCLGPLATTPRHRLSLVVAVGLAVSLKALCGYEYITTVIFSPLAAAWFHLDRAGEGLRRKAVAAAALLAAGLAGFALALGTHVLQIETVLQENGLAAILDRAAARTAGGTENEIPDAKPGETSRTAFAVACFREYFGQRALSSPEWFGKRAFDVPLNSVVIAAGAFAAVAVLLRSKLPRDVRALAGALALALAAGVSWQVLAVNHMCVHRHLNLIVYAVPFLPAVFVAAGYSLRWCGPRLGFASLIATTALMGTNAVLANVRARAEVRQQAAAEAAPALTETGNAPGVSGHIDRSCPASQIEPALLVEWGLFDANRSGPSDPAALVVSGWALSEWKPTRTPSTRLVVMCGESVLPSRVQWFRRPDLDALARKPMPWAGFVLVVPSEAIPSGGTVRVFAVDASDPSRRIELPMP